VLVSSARRPSPQTVAILRAFATDPGTWRYGYVLSTQLGIKAGSLYPILMRLADRGLLETAWETDPPTGRPPRHLYRLTDAGLRYAAALPTSASATSTSTTAAGTRLRGKPA
jgi:DNA-binding PadR family transcriptional regulator